MSDKPFKEAFLGERLRNVSLANLKISYTAYEHFGQQDTQRSKDIKAEIENRERLMVHSQNKSRSEGL